MALFSSGFALSDAGQIEENADLQSDLIRQGNV